jgi:hypothetical protein
LKKTGVEEAEAVLSGWLEMPLKTAKKCPDTDDKRSGQISLSS